MTVDFFADRILELLKRELGARPVHIEYFDCDGECRTSGEFVDMRFDEKRDVVVLEIREELGSVVDDVIDDATERFGVLPVIRITKHDDPSMEKEM